MVNAYTIETNIRGTWVVVIWTLIIIFTAIAFRSIRFRYTHAMVIFTDNLSAIDSVINTRNI